MTKLALCKLGIAILCAPLAMAPLAMALTDDEQEHKNLMKEVGSTAGKWRKSETKTGADIAQDARKMETTFKTVEGFWNKRHHEDAVKWSQDAKLAAASLATAAEAGSTEQATASIKSFMGTCSGCHTAYRDKLPDGSYKIKEGK